MIQLLILGLSLGGLIISLYFTFAYYGRVKHSRWVPEMWCAREGSSCLTVVQTPYARVFGVPNSLLGIVFYAALIAWLLVPARTGVVMFDSALPVWRAGLWFFLPASIATVALGFYLVYALRRILHLDCPLCYTAHAINLALLVLLWTVAR